MGPKAKTAKGGGVKAEWVLCPDTGLLHHSQDSARHAGWLQDGAGGGPPYPHIAGERLTAGLVQVPRAKLGLVLPEEVIFSSVFVSPAVASVCKFGQGSLGRFEIGGSCLVFRVFVSSNLAGQSQICCVSQSWPALLSLPPSCLPSLSSLPAPVHLAPVARVRLPPSPGQDAARLRAAATHHLRELVLAPRSTVPFSYYGSRVELLVNCGEVEGELDLTAEMAGLSVSPEKRLLLPGGSSAVTSTPVKSCGEALQQSQESVGTPGSQYYRVSQATKVVFEDQAARTPVARPQFLGGLEAEVAAIRSSLAPVLEGRGGARRLMTGLLLFGPPGTGKTSLARLLPSLLRCRLVTVQGPELYSKFYGETEAQLRAKFEEAAAAAPCILFIDELDSLAPRRDSGASDQERRVGATLLCLLDQVAREDSRVVVVAATSRLESLDPGLRRPGRLDMEVEVGVPGVRGRDSILTGLLEEQGSELDREEVARLARDTHGFVGADLQALVSLACIEARGGEGGSLTMDHFLTVRPRVKPSAMREVMVEVPEVSWSDIGGLEELKLKLRQAVEWPIKHPEVFTRMGISAPRGLLMYGPPGCSKTMIAKALANESGLNFLSIKGPELFSKWVGESERAVREVFRRARQVKPSIVFFDEIDAIGGARGGGGSGKVGDRVLAQLLTEMDGVEGLAGVTVVAATNRPDMMDQALLRPGRLDRVVYVPLPDLATRRQVLAVHTRKIPTAASVDLELVAGRTAGYSGAEVTAVCNEAAMAALEESVEAEVVEQRHFEVALASVKPRITAELFDVYERFQADNTSKKV